MAWPREKERASRKEKAMAKDIKSFQSFQFFLSLPLSPLPCLPLVQHSHKRQHLPETLHQSQHSHHHRDPPYPPPFDLQPYQPYLRRSDRQFLLRFPYQRAHPQRIFQRYHPHFLQLSSHQCPRYQPSNAGQPRSTTTFQFQIGTNIMVQCRRE